MLMPWQHINDLINIKAHHDDNKSEWIISSNQEKFNNDKKAFLQRGFL